VEGRVANATIETPTAPNLELRFTAHVLACFGLRASQHEGRAHGHRLPLLCIPLFARLPLSSWSPLHKSINNKYEANKATTFRWLALFSELFAARARA